MLKVSQPKERLFVKVQIQNSEFLEQILSKNFYLAGSLAACKKYVENDDTIESTDDEEDIFDTKHSKKG